MTASQLLYPQWIEWLAPYALIFGVSLVIATALLDVRDWWSGRKKISSDSTSLEFTPLKEATEKVYTACRASKNEQHRLFEAIEVSGIKPIVYLAQIIVAEKNLFGKKPHSNHIENTNDLEGRLSPELDSLTDYTGKVLFSDLMVKTTRMNTFLEDIKNDQ